MFVVDSSIFPLKRWRTAFSPKFAGIYLCNDVLHKTIAACFSDRTFETQERARLEKREISFFRNMISVMSAERGIAVPRLLSPSREHKYLMGRNVVMYSTHKICSAVELSRDEHTC